MVCAAHAATFTLTIWRQRQGPSSVGLLALPGTQPGEGHAELGKLRLDTRTGETREQGFPAEVKGEQAKEVGKEGAPGGEGQCAKGQPGKQAAQLTLGPCQAAALALPGGTSSDKGNRGLRGQTA